MTDNVNHPKHYEGKIECIDAIEAMVENDPGFIAHCKANALGYIWRAGKKTEDPKEDIEKAIWYLNKIIKSKEENKHAVMLEGVDSSVYNIILTKFKRNDKIEAIKVIRNVTNASLQDVEDIVNQLFLQQEFEYIMRRLTCKEIEAIGTVFEFNYTIFQ